jgi:hypothetical protein
LIANVAANKVTKRLTVFARRTKKASSFLNFQLMNMRPVVPVSKRKIKPQEVKVAKRRHASAQ